MTIVILSGIPIAEHIGDIVEIISYLYSLRSQAGAWVRE